MKYMVFTSLLMPALLCCASCSWGEKHEPVAQKMGTPEVAIEQPTDTLPERVVEKGLDAEVQTREIDVWGVQEISTQEEFDALFTAGYPVAVKFYGTFCPPCRRMRPVFEKLAQDFEGQIRFVAIEVQQPGARALARAYASHGVPSFVVFDKDGQYLATRLGAATEAELSRFIAGHCLGVSI